MRNKLQIVGYISLVICFMSIGFALFVDYSMRMSLNEKMSVNSSVIMNEITSLRDEAYTDSIYIIADTSGTIILTSNNINRIGWKATELVGNPISVLLADEFIEEHETAYKAAVKVDHPKCNTANINGGMLKRKDGSKYVVNVLSVELTSKTGKNYLCRIQIKNGDDHEH